MRDLRGTLETVCEVCVEAGRLIRRIRGEGFDVTAKRDRSPVTEADRRSDALLRERLPALVPAAWLSEESAASADRLDRERVWVVDPLDGTKEFTQGLAEYTVAVALIERGVPVLGVVHNPATGETFSAGRGLGAFLDGEPVRVAEGGRLLASRSEIDRGEFAPFEEEWEVAPVGSIEYKLGLVGAGRGNVTFSRGPKHEWDVCAGALIVAEAGGIASDVLGGPLVFNQPFPKTKGILAGAPRTYERALRQLTRVGVSDRMAELDGPGRG